MIVVRTFLWLCAAACLCIAAYAGVQWAFNPAVKDMLVAAGLFGFSGLLFVAAVRFADERL